MWWMPCLNASSMPKNRALRSVTPRGGCSSEKRSSRPGTTQPRTLWLQTSSTSRSYEGWSSGSIAVIGWDIHHLKYKNVLCLSSDFLWFEWWFVHCPQVLRRECSSFSHLLWFISFLFPHSFFFRSVSFLSVFYFPGGGGSGGAGVSAVLRGLRLWDSRGTSVESHSVLHPRQRDQLGQNRGEMGSVHHGCS